MLYGLLFNVIVFFIVYILCVSVLISVDLLELLGFIMVRSFLFLVLFEILFSKCSGLGLLFLRFGNRVFLYCCYWDCFLYIV